MGYRLSSTGFALVLAAGLAQLARAEQGTVDGTLAGLRFRLASAAAGIGFHQRTWSGERNKGFLKMNQYMHGTAVLVADVNDDSWMDICFLQQDGPNELYLGRAGGTFSERACSAGVALDDRSSSGGCFGDYDNDGRVDLYVTTVRMGNVLFHNEGLDELGQVRFKDVSARAGVGLISHSVSATWVDLDNDGFLDLYVMNQEGWTKDGFDKVLGYYPGGEHVMLMPMESAMPGKDVFFHNNGDGSFSDWTERIGIITDPMEFNAGKPLPVTAGDENGQPVSAKMAMIRSMDVSLTDFDDDGWIDLYLSNGHGYDALYRNRGDGSLELVTDEVLGRTSWGSFGSQWTDIDNDGLLDLYVVDMHSDMWIPGHAWTVDEQVFPIRYNTGGGPELKDFVTPLGPDHPYIYGNSCFINDGGGRMQEVGEVVGLENWWPWGLVHADFNLDGWQDFFAAAGMGWPWNYSPCFLHLNKGGRGFVEAARQAGIEPPEGGVYVPGFEEPFARSARSAAVLDGNNDGRPDLAVLMWDDQARYFENQLPDGRSWLGFELRGRKVNRDAVGAKVSVSWKGRTQVQIVSNACGYLSQSDPRLVFGLGAADKVDEVEVVWPGGKRQKVEAWTLNSYNRITETE